MAASSSSRLLLLCLWLCLLAATTRGCLEPQPKFEDQMDVSSGACEDYFEHACGNWHANSALRALGAHDTLTKLRALNKQRLLQHLERQTSHSLAVVFYNACVSQWRTLRDFTAVLSGLADWPLLHASAEPAADFCWPKVSAQLRGLGADALWRLQVLPNWQAAEQLIVYLLPPRFELLRSAEGPEAYAGYVQDLLVELGVRVRQAGTMAAELLAFEQQLLALLPPQELQSTVLHAPQTLQSLHAQLPELQLLTYFDTLLAEQQLPKDYAQQLLIVADTDYLQQLQRLLRNSNSNSNSSSSSSSVTNTLPNWLLLQFLVHFEFNLHENRTLTAQREHCLQQLGELLPQPLHELFVQLLGEQHVAEAQAQLQREFAALKLQFEQWLNGSSVFEHSNETQQLSVEKLRDMRLLLLEPSLRVPNATLPMSVSYDIQLMLLQQQQQQGQFEQLARCLAGGADCAGNATLSNSGPLDVQAYYDKQQNAVVLPVGLLGAPLGSKCDSAARLAGSLGQLLAQQLLHGYDYDSINYDQQSNASMWTPRALIRYGLLVACYQQQHDSNATVNLMERMIDGEALRLAFETYRRAEPTGEAQPFFVAYAQRWCGQAAPAPTAATQHAAHRERVNNALSNLPEFAEAYGCPSGGNMNPDDKCRVW